MARGGKARSHPRELHQSRLSENRSPMHTLASCRLNGQLDLGFSISKQAHEKHQTLANQLQRKLNEDEDGSAATDWIRAQLTASHLPSFDVCFNSSASRLEVRRSSLLPAGAHARLALQCIHSYQQPLWWWQRGSHAPRSCTTVQHWWHRHGSRDGALSPRHGSRAAPSA